MEDRDWYRAEARARQRAAEASAEPGWRRAEGRDQPHRTSGTIQQLIYVGIVLAAGVVVVLHDGNGSGIPGRVEALGQWTQSMERSWWRAVPFPANGTVAAVPEASDDTAPFMVQTPYQPDRRYVVALKEW